MDIEPTHLQLYVVNKFQGNLNIIIALHKGIVSSKMFEFESIKGKPDELAHKYVILLTVHITVESLI